MNTTPSNQLPLPISCALTSEQKLARLSEKIARLHDVTVGEVVHREKLRARAYYLVGEIVLSNPELLARVAPVLEPALAKLGPARKVVDGYSRTMDELAQFKALLR